MRLTAARNIPTICRNCWRLRLRVALPFVVALTGCNSCVTFISNPPNGTLGIVATDPKPACTLPKVMSAVRLRLAGGPACSSCVGSSQVKHIFLSIRGIELNSNAAVRDDAPDWQELLLPELEQKPLQIDLFENNAVQGVQEPFERTAHIPAGIYRQLRLRLVPNQPAAEDRLPENNPCGSGTFNCIVMADGGIQPLQLDDGSSELRITLDRVDGASLLFSPDADADLIIELKFVWEWSSSADRGIRLLPALIGSAKVRYIKLDEWGTPEGGVVNDSHSR